jgi:hypothetical protein
MNHRPNDEAGCDAVEDRQEASEQGDPGAGGSHAQKLQPAHDRRAEQAEAYCGSKLKKQTDQDGCGMGLKIRHDDSGGFPRPWPANFASHSGDWVQAGIKQRSVQDCQESQRRAGMVL